MIYIFIFIIFSIVSFFEDKKKNVNLKKILILVSGMIFLFISAFRYKTGMDWYNYLYEYNNLEISNKVYSSIGYIFLEKIGNYLKIDYFLFQALICLFAGIVIINFYKNNSKKYWTSITIYYLLFYLDYNLALQKQLLAISFCLLGFQKLKKSKIEFYLFSLLGALFHFSAIIFVLGTMFINIIFKIKYKYIINIFSLLMIFSLNFNIIEIIFNIILFLKIPVLSQRISAYSSISYYARTVSPSLFLSIYLIMEIILLYFILIKRPPKTSEEKYIYFYSIMYIFLKTISLKMYILYRLISYFGIFYCIFLTYFLEIIKLKEDVF